MAAKYKEKKIFYQHEIQTIYVKSAGYQKVFETIERLHSECYFCDRQEPRFLIMHPLRLRSLGHFLKLKKIQTLTSFLKTLFISLFNQN